MSGKKNLLFLLNLILLILFLSACGEKEVGLNLAQTNKYESTTYEAPKPLSYDSKGTAIVEKISEINKTITFYDYDLEKSYTLEYDGVTRFSDKYDTAMSLSQVKVGRLVDVLFLKSSKHLVSLKESDASFTLDEISDFSINSGAKVFTYKSDAYKITEGTILISDNKKMSISDLNALDKITLVGVDSTIYSIVVEEGHGFLNIKNAANLVGGFLEIGAKQIEKISDPMLITLPAGSYDLRITAKGADETRKVVIKANEETILDLKDVEIQEVKIGRVLFNVTPDTAVMYVDGKPVDFTELLPLEYGIHQVNVSATGYDSITRYVNVQEDTATLSVILDKKEDTKKEEKEETKSKTEGYYLYITSPSNVEVYVDNIYIGLSPIVVKKTAGNHIITLRKSGYTTRSYTLSIQDEEGDVTYTFEDLVATSNTSENDVSANE